MIAEYELNAQDAATLTATREFADRFEAAAHGAQSAARGQRAAERVGGRLKALGLEQEQSPVSMAGIVHGRRSAGRGQDQLQAAEALLDVCFEKGEDFPPSTSAKSRSRSRMRRRLRR
jgi:aspartyl-tRNA(Asn)/glutamyl-tRNA(Gln) amidotransferase subunit B